ASPPRTTSFSESAKSRPSQLRPTRAVPDPIFSALFLKTYQSTEPQLTRIPAEKTTFPFFEQSVINDQPRNHQLSL
ncbi:hypothetical protein, partial [Achromobacter sp. ACRQX]|uniref:hypothetical protein n=1 Tax=Achromobacter sp. ACRQX TaxID=2918181 RepID=UPI001EF26075